MEGVSSCTLQTRRRPIVLGQRQSRSIIHQRKKEIKKQSVHQQIIRTKHTLIKSLFRELQWLGSWIIKPFKLSFTNYQNQLLVQPLLNHLSSRIKIFVTMQAFVSSTCLTTSSLNQSSILQTSIIHPTPWVWSHTCSITSCHRTPSFPLLRHPMVSLLDLLFPRDLFGAQTKSTVPGPQQSAHGKNIQEVSYQEGSKDRITHTESSGFHFIEIHQGTVRGETLSWPTLRAGSLPKNVGMESGRQFFPRVGKWPTLFFSNWKMADNFFFKSGKLPTYILFSKYTAKLGLFCRSLS